VRGSTRSLAREIKVFFTRASQKDRANALRESTGITEPRMRSPHYRDCRSSLKIPDRIFLDFISHRIDRAKHAHVAQKASPLSCGASVTGFRSPACYGSGAHERFFRIGFRDCASKSRINIKDARK